MGIEFAIDAGIGIAQVLDAPMRWAQIEPGIRKYRLGRFPYALYYKVDPPASVVIFAVVDLRSHPDAWRRRKR